jgi:AraC-like DNA-binding protein
MTGRRRAVELRQTPGEYVALLMVHRGTEHLVQHGRTAEVQAGTAALWDGVRPVECHTPNVLVKHTLFVPRALLRDSLPDLDGVLVRTISASSSLRLLTSWLRTSMHEPVLDPDIAHTAGRVAVDLLRSVVGRAAGEPVDDTRAVRLIRARSYVDHNLADPELSLADVAAAVPVSLRYLHMLFHDSGETARQYVLRRRLERAQELLLAPGTPMPVAEVAARSGFDSPSAFSRAYRARYGCTPRDARRDVVRETACT